MCIRDSPETLLSNGAFIVESYEPAAQSFSFVKNPDYYNADSVQLDGLNYRVIKDSQQALMAYQNGTLDVVKLSGDQVDQVKDDPELNVVGAVSYTHLGPVLICCGDMPLITKETYKSLAEAHAASGGACTVLAGITDEKLPYGRIVRDENGGFLRMVEEKDCTPEELLIKELNSGVYVFDSQKLFAALKEIKNNNAQGEYYLTDVPEILRLQGERVGVFSKEIGREIIGVNTVEQLTEVEEIIKEREK